MGMIASFKSKMKERRIRQRVSTLKASGDVEGLVGAMRDEDKQFRWEATTAIAQIGKPAVNRLIQALKDKDCKVRSLAAEALGQIGDTRAVEPLVHGLSDKDRDVVYFTTSALGRIGDARTVGPLVEILKHSEYINVRRVAAEALGEIGDARAVEPLVQALNDANTVFQQEKEEMRAESKKLGVSPQQDPVLLAARMVLSKRDLSSWAGVQMSARKALEKIDTKNKSRTLDDR